MPQIRMLHQFPVAMALLIQNLRPLVGRLVIDTLQSYWNLPGTAIFSPASLSFFAEASFMTNGAILSSKGNTEANPGAHAEAVAVTLAMVGSTLPSKTGGVDHDSPRL